MIDVYFPSVSTLEYLQSILLGFYIEVSNKGKVTLLVKLEPSILASIIQGCRLQLVIRNPNIESRSCTLYVFDKTNDPFFFTWGNFGEEDLNHKGFDKAVINLVLHHQEITLVLFNELNHPVFTVDLPIGSNKNSFEQWFYKLSHSKEYQNLRRRSFRGSYFPENEKQGFTIEIQNSDHSASDKMSFLSSEYADEWRQNSNSKGSYFNYNDYQGGGKHGNLQELGVTTNLATFFKVGVDFFPSPKYADGLEFTDYIIIDNNATIIIESKYIVSDKQTKKHQALRKAVLQLNKVEQLIASNDLVLEDNKLQETLKKVKVVLKICLLNDQIELNDRNTKALTNEFEKEELPLFTSVTGLTSLLVQLQLKNEKYLRPNLFYNLIQIFNGYFSSEDKILYEHGFIVEGLSAEELNAIGKKNREV